MLRHILQQLLDKKDLSIDQCQEVIESILQGADAIQVAAFLMLLQAKSVSALELYGLVAAMRKHMIPVSVNEPVLDIVGTGGDCMNTVNISTAASIIVASCGVKVAKHGNRSVSSACGSADLLEAWGIKIDMNAAQVAESIHRVGIGFCFAPHFHPTMAVLKPIRNALKMPTVFNLIGPLLNPAQAQYYLLGVADSNKMLLMAEALFKLQVERAFVVHSMGLDELSLLGPADVIEVTREEIVPCTIFPEDYGFKKGSLADIQGNGAEVNRKRLQAVFAGEASILADTIIFNAGTALHVSGFAPSIADGIELARSSLQTGAAQQFLSRWQKFSQTCD